MKILGISCFYHDAAAALVIDGELMAGGVALNYTANGLLLRKKLFKNIYVQPASGDAGGAAGSALYVHHKITGENKRKQRFFNLGSVYSDDEIKKFLEMQGIPYLKNEEIKSVRRAAQEMADGKIVGIYQGSAEYGPRALGFRSILADPRDNQMKENINAAVKYREPFRPFAPAVMIEDAPDYFECDGNEYPYMLFNFKVHEEKRGIIPDVTHVDNSSRIQTVSKDDNPVFHNIISELKDITGVAVVLNTSFNHRGYPIVNTPEDAFATFCSGGIDILLLGNYIVDKKAITKELYNKYRFEKADD